MAYFKKIYVEGYAKMAPQLTQPRLIEVINLVKKTIPKNSEIRILDVGCGDGIFAVELGKVLGTRKIFGVDISQKAVKSARNNTVSAQLLDIDKNKFPYKANYFHVVFCGSLIEVVLEPDQLLKELHRILTPDGHLIITFPNHCAWASRLAILLGFLPYYYRVSREYDLGKMFLPKRKGESTGFIRLFSLCSFKELAQTYGFEIAKVRGIREYHIPRPMQILDAILSKKPSFAFQIICVLTKS